MVAFKNKFFLPLLVSSTFFIVGLATLSDYGISWDEPEHFHRGQGYLHFFLTSEKQFNNVWGKQSYYQSNSLPASFFFERDSGHPPLNGILAALTNLIFYQQLGILGDVESHHLFNIFVSSLLIFIVSLFALETFGIFAAIIAALSLSLYPLFFAESRFNVKDPAEAAFFSLTIYAFWKAINSRNWKWLILSAVGFGMGLGTKFNILFLPFILIPWAVYKIFYLDKGKFIFTKKFIIAFLSAPIIVLIIFIGSWPFLWADPVNNLLKIFGFYKQIGTGFNYQTTQYYLRFGLNSYPLLWIFYTTPPYVLFLSFIGVVGALINFKRKDGATILWLLWLAVPISRVTMPGTSIYGGIRQIMEFIPALALMAALGAFFILNQIEKRTPSLNINLVKMFLLVGFLQIALVLIKIHPNQNVYFNSFIGGLSGAKAAEIPSWGNSYGNAYYQAVGWLNRNAEPGAKIALVQGTALNIPKTIFRSDLIFNNQVWSGMYRQGEYMLELTHHNPVKVYPYAWDYIENVLEPVYEVKVDGVAIAKVWKNDLTNSKPKFRKDEDEIEFSIRSSPQEKSLIFDLVSDVNLSRVTILYNSNDCDKPIGSVALSIDGINYINEPDPYPNEFVTEHNRQQNTIYQYFAVPKARNIKFTDKSKKSCIFNNPQISIKGFNEKN